MGSKAKNRGPWIGGKRMRSRRLIENCPDGQWANVAGYVTREGKTMIIVRGPLEFLMAHRNTNATDCLTRFNTAWNPAVVCHS